MICFFRKLVTDPTYECFSLSFISICEKRLNSLLVGTILKIFLQEGVDACLGNAQFSN